MIKFNKKVFNLLKLFVLFFILNNEAAAREIYTYRDPIFPRKRLSLDISENQFLVADIAIPMTVCNKNERYICIFSDGFFFHVPHSIAPEEKEWKVDEISYKIEANEDMAVWGKSHKVFRIHGARKKMQLIYIYSVEAGLLGFSFVDKRSGARGIYLLDGSCGYGASAHCR